MRVLGIRFCAVSAQAEAIASFLGKGLGMPQRDAGLDSASGFPGAIFPAGNSWVELWPAGPGMPSLTMLQIVVDDADAWAAQARANGLNPRGPTDAHGERIYSLTGPNGFEISFQSRLG